MHRTTGLLRKAAKCTSSSARRSRAVATAAAESSHVRPTFAFQAATAYSSPTSYLAAGPPPPTPHDRGTGVKDAHTKKGGAGRRYGGNEKKKKEEGGTWQALLFPGASSTVGGEPSNTWPLVTLDATPRSQLLRTLVHLMRPTMNTRTLGKL